jgi:hypothetical protein
MFMNREEAEKRYFTMVPNIVFQMGLPVHALALYVHIVRTAGWTGECFKSARALAEELQCSVAQSPMQSDNCNARF